MFCTTSCIKIAVGGALTVGCMYYTAKVVAVGCMYPVARALLPRTAASDPPQAVSNDADRKRIRELEQQVQSLTEAAETHRVALEAVQRFNHELRVRDRGLQVRDDRYSDFCFRLPDMAASIVQQFPWGKDAPKDDVIDAFISLTDEFSRARATYASMEQFLVKYDPS